MATTYIAIATTTVGSGGASSINFSSIPGSYTDLVLMVSARDNRPSSQDSEFYVKFNNNTDNYSYRLIYGGGTGPGGSSSGSTYPPSVINSAGSTANSFSSSFIYIPNYAGSNYKNLSIDGVDEGNAATGQYVYLVAGLWSNSSAINQITLTPFGGYSFLQYSTATLYGIKSS
jgi:hypothetical protein